jgi:uncharacterized glyoxalase superfamily protein PhnB
MKPAGGRFFAEMTEINIEKQMSISKSNDIRAVVPTITYRNTTAMVEWLCDTFGFRRQLIVKGENGEVKHAELTFGECMIMVEAVQHSPFEKLVVHPDQIGGVETQTCYLIVADVEAYCAKVKAKNAEIIFGVKAENGGGQGYACRDPEGHLWMFGTYDPRQDQTPRIRNGPEQIGFRKGKSLLPLVLSALVLASTAVALWSYSEMRRQTILLGSVTGLTHAPPSHGGTAVQAIEREPKSLAAKLIEVQAAKENAEQNSKDFAAELARERVARDGAVQSGKQAQELLAQELRAKELLSRTAEQVKDQLGRERVARETAERLAKDATDQLNNLRFAKAASDRTAKEATERCEQGSRAVTERAFPDAKDQLARERNARAVAELAANELRNQLVSVGPDAQERIAELRYRIEAERRANGVADRAVKDVKLQLAQEKYSRDAAERALRQTEQKLAAAPSCWSCPTAAPCERH